MSPDAHNQLSTENTDLEMASTALPKYWQIDLQTRVRIECAIMCKLKPIPELGEQGFFFFFFVNVFG